MLKINNEREEKVSFGSLKVGDVFIDPTDNEYDVCIKIDDDEEEENTAFSFYHCVPFRRDNFDEVIPVREATLTVK